MTTLAFVPIAANARADDGVREPLISSRILQRVVKTFDFAEERVGNFESTPMNWEPYVAPGYPPYSRASFDKSFGHTARPCMRLSVLGESVASTYRATDIPVHPKSDYRIDAWVRVEKMVHARALISAVFLDRSARPIDRSERFSEAIASSDAGDRWQRLNVTLPGGYPDARWISITAWIVQAPERPSRTAELRPIRITDARASAWFDDISVWRLPRTSLEIDAARDGRASERCLRVSVSDVDPSDLSARLELFDASRRCILARRISISTEEGGETRIGLDDLDVGWYRAVLGVDSTDGPLAMRSVNVLRESSDLPQPDSKSGFLGLSLEDESRSGGATEAESLIRWLGAGAVKISLWNSTTSDAVLVAGDAVRDRALARLHGAGVKLVGVLDAPPPSLARRFPPTRRELSDILAAPPEQWRAYLAFLTTRYGGQVDAWQVGSIEADTPGTQAIAHARSEIDRLAAGRALLVAPWKARLEPSRSAAPSDVLDVVIPADWPARTIMRQLQSFRDAGYRDVWVSIASADSRSVSTATGSELVKRVIASRQSGASRVFVDPPWVREARNNVMLQPRENALALRTISALLGNRRPLGAADLGPDIQAFFFAGAEEDDGALVAWSDDVRGGIQRVTRVLGQGTHCYDLLGRGRPVQGGPDGTCIEIVGEPRIFAPINASLIAFQSAFTFEKPAVQPGEFDAVRNLVVRNPFSRRLSGRLRMTPPQGWSMHPAAAEFNMAPDGVCRIPVEIRISRNAPAGRFELPIDLELQQKTNKSLRVFAPIEVALRDLEVAVVSEVVGDRLLIQQRITNRGSETLALRSMMLSPEHPREIRRIAALAPGETTVVEYSLDRASRLGDRVVRISLFRTDTNTVHNALVRFMDGKTARAREQAASGPGEYANRGKRRP